MTRILRDGALLSVVASTYLLVLLRLNPRIFLRHYPKEIREIVPPKSEKERQMSISPAWMRHGNQSLASVLPNAQYRTLEGQTHMLKPKAHAPLLVEFFKG